MKSVRWSIPGAFPEDCLHPEKLLLQGGEGINASHLIVSYRFFEEDLAEEIAQALPPKQGEIFRQLRQIDPAELQKQNVWQRFWRQPKPHVTWLQYAKRLGYDDETFWMAWAGASHEIEMFLRRRAA